MKARMNLPFLVLLFLLLSSGSTLLAWTEPVPVTHVNTEYGDRTPFLSYDGLTLYFSRVDTSDFYYARIYQVNREYASAPFTEVIEISSLNYSGGHVHCPWVSPDNMRMYYHRTESGSRHRLKVSKRESITDPWPQGTNIIELNTLGSNNHPSLTQDELTIVFMSNNITDGRGRYDLYIATRLDLNSPFGNVINLTELNTPANDVDPFISPDGLSLYFASDINGYYQIYKATRGSSEETFGAIEHLSFFDTPEANSRFPSISSDGSTFYFCRELEGAVVSADIYVSYISDTIETKTYYVEAVHGSDDNEGLTPGTAFATIQKGVDAAVDGEIVRVYPGLYLEEINFLGKMIVVQGVTAGTAGVPVLWNPGDFAVSFYYGEGPDSILKNFIIRDSFMGVFIVDSSPTISNLTIVGNTYGIEAYADSEPDISNTILWNNTDGDLFGCQARYSCVERGGEGNITDDPLFVDPDNDDYHIRSERGRYWPEYDIWVLDKVTSPCVDGGDPDAEALNEPMPNGGRINIGAYGGTIEASLSLGEQLSRLGNEASNPYPADGAENVEGPVLLTWTAGLNTVSHDVYLGTDRNAVTNADKSDMTGTYLGRQAATSYMPREFVWYTMTYYWRIDEVDSEGNTTRGDVWTFSTTSPPPPKGRACFLNNTHVWVDGTLMQISKVAAGQTTTTVTFLTTVTKQIEKLEEHEGTFTCYDVLLESGNCISVAENHYFLAESGQWISLKNLKKATKLQTPNGSIVLVSVTKRPMPYVGKVYNLKVEGSDRYLVGKDAVIVRDY